MVGFLAWKAGMAVFFTTSMKSPGQSCSNSVTGFALGAGAVSVFAAPLALPVAPWLAPQAASASALPDAVTAPTPEINAERRVRRVVHCSWVAMAACSFEYLRLANAPG